MQLPAVDYVKDQFRHNKILGYFDQINISVHECLTSSLFFAKALNFAARLNSSLNLCEEHHAM
jgi:hypothetical protein